MTTKKIDDKELIKTVMNGISISYACKFCKKTIYQGKPIIDSKSKEIYQKHLLKCKIYDVIKSLSDAGLTMEEIVKVAEIFVGKNKGKKREGNK